MPRISPPLPALYLKEKEEEIVIAKNLTGRSAFMNLFDEFTGSFVFHLKIGEQEKELTGSEMLALLHSPDRELREEAFRTFLQYHGRTAWFSRPLQCPGPGLPGGG